MIKLNKTVNKNNLKPNFFNKFYDEELITVFRNLLLNKNLHI